MNVSNRMAYFWAACGPNERIDLYLELASPVSAHAGTPVEIARTSPCSMMPILQRRLALEDDQEEAEALLVWMYISRRASHCEVDAAALREWSSIVVSGRELRPESSALLVDCILKDIECAGVLERARRQPE